MGIHCWLMCLLVWENPRNQSGTSKWRTHGRCHRFIRFIHQKSDIENFDGSNMYSNPMNFDVRSILVGLIFSNNHNRLSTIFW